MLRVARTGLHPHPHPQERVRVKRHLVDLEELHLQHTIELNKRQLELDFYDTMAAASSNSAPAVCVVCCVPLRFVVVFARVSS